MRNFFGVVAVLTAAAFALSTVNKAHAGEMLLGTIYVPDGGSATNRCTATPFVIPPSSRITVQCSAESYVGTNVGGCDGGTCLKITADAIFPTSVGNVVAKCTAINGGATTYTGGHLAMSTATVSYCRVYSRSGTE